MELKVLSLNCWGVFVPVSCQYRSKRIEAIGLQLAKGEYDIVMLQEIWSDSDYSRLCELTANCLPYSHYFYSGNFGGGICIFSKYVIYETFEHRYSLNGHPHRVFCGDWFCGKLVGLAKLLINDMHVFVYNTHLHAQYYDPDDFEGHRIAQSFELAQFVRTTSENCDLVLVGGDFNYRPDQLGYRVVRVLASLEDAWLTRRNKSSEGDSYELTCDRPENSFCTASEKHPQGVTLDYIMYRQHAGYMVSCSTCSLAMRKIPGETYQYSDHEGVEAHFTVKRNVTAGGQERNSIEIEKTLTDVLPVLDKGMKQTQSSRTFYLSITLLSFIMLSFTYNSNPLGFLPLAGGLLCLALSFVFALSLLMGVLWCGREFRAFQTVRQNVTIALKGIHIH